MKKITNIKAPRGVCPECNGGGLEVTPDGEESVCEWCRGIGKVYIWEYEVWERWEEEMRSWGWSKE